MTALPAGEKPGRTPGTVRVWDRFVRVFHWTLAGAFFVAYFTEDDLLTLHAWAGYLVGALIVLRVIWGFVGPRHARFTDFLYSPWKAWRYLLALLTFRAERHLGHSPAAGAMVFALLAGLALTVWSGLETYAIEEGLGPLAGPAAVERQASSASSLLILASDETAKSGDGGDSIWEAVHEAISNLMFIFVLLHIGGVVVASLVHRENLVRAMITGDKRAE